MKSTITLVCIITSALATACLAETPVPLPAQWQRLLDGNARFVSDQPRHQHQDSKRRAEVASGQKPFAVVIGCADSRTAPEILFDEGLGDLFVIRLAGNIVDDAALGSIEYAIAKLGTRLIVVLGHEKCGAVSAAVEAVNGAAAPPGHIGAIVDVIKPAAASVHGKDGDEIDNAVRANVHAVVERLKTASPLLSPLLKSGELSLIGARYDLDDGKVQQVP
ncbi:MAG: carbonic anhydrase [Chthoniobacteraceae bacterium]